MDYVRNSFCSLNSWDFFECGQQFKTLMQPLLSSSCSILLGRGVRSVIMIQLDIDHLGLRSLKEISDGDVAIIKNKNLCYTNKSLWERLFKLDSQIATVEENADAATCGELSAALQTLDHATGELISKWGVISQTSA